jgi:formylglycine-generating enzyme required for sulfatase activity
MRHLRADVAAVAILLAALPAAAQTPKKCPIESVKVGNVCIDKYEASVWEVPVGATSLVKRIQQGKVTLDDLVASGATQVSAGLFCNPSFPLTFPATGNWSAPLYAASVPGVPPTGCATWFQAEQACALSGKRLATNQEWQRAAAGTPDPGATPGPADCNTNSSGPSDTASRGNCVSAWGTFDMVGNLTEWVADWVGAAPAPNCTTWSAGLGDDRSCVGGDGSEPAALLRGGHLLHGTAAGGFAIEALAPGLGSSSYIGFRCAR